MSDRIKVKPAPGIIVRNPEAGFIPLPPEGAEVVRTIYWLKREREGAVTITELPKAVREKAAKAAKAEG